MSFTIKCNECGNEQVFKPLDKARNTQIDIEINMAGTWEQYPDYITIYCENPKCINNVDLNYSY